MSAPEVETVYCMRCGEVGKETPWGAICDLCLFNWEEDDPLGELDTAELEEEPETEEEARARFL